MLKVKRVYEPGKDQDGYRVLVDRLWPRGLTKQKAKINLWLKDIAPSNELRKWFAHDPEKWDDFQKKYLQELKRNKGLLDKIKQLENEKGIVTLLYAARDTKHNNAKVLLDAIINTRGRSFSPSEMSK